MGKTFQRIWSTKEAVTKAVGQGIDFGIDRIEVDLGGNISFADTIFHYLRQWWQPDTETEVPEAKAPDVCVCIDIWRRPEWRIEQALLGHDHWVSVALGPIAEMVDNNGEFAATMRLHGADHEIRKFASSWCLPEFEVLHISDVVPVSARSRLGYDSCPIERQRVGYSPNRCPY